MGDPFAAYELSLRQSKKHKITVFTWNKNARTSLEYVNNNFKIRRLKGQNLALKPFFAEYPFIPNLDEIIKKEAPDVIHAHSHLFPTSFYSIKIAKKLGIPSVISVHGLMAERETITNLLQYIYLRSVSSWIFKKSTTIVCETRNQSDQISRLGSSNERVRIVPTPVDTIFFKPCPILEKNNLIVWTGHFVPEKGLKYLIEAAKKVVRTNRNVKFLLIGTGPQRPKLVKMIKNLHLGNNVFLIGPVEKRQIARFLAEASIFVFPSLSEGMPKSVLEAMSTGKPVIASNIPGMSETIKEDENGILVPPRNSEKLANVILKLLGDEKLRENLGRNARKTVLKRFTWGRILGLYNAVYEEAVKTKIRN
jgi:glycosyltransferase involved in cell wall biosynthesis